jgi:glycosyltransferase involved in cell wall biosynthesis
MINKQLLNNLFRILLVFCILFIFNKIFENYNLIKYQLIENKYEAFIILIVFIIYQILLSYKNFFLLNKYTKLNTSFGKWQEVFFTSILYNFIIILTGTIYRAKKAKDFGVPYLKYAVMLYFNYYVYIVFSLFTSMLVLYFLDNPHISINNIVFLALIFFLSFYFIPNITIYLTHKVKFFNKNFFFNKILNLIIQVKIIFKNKELISYAIFFNLIIILFEITIFYFICKIFYNDLNFIEFFLLYLAKFLLDIVFMTASFFGYNEVLFAIFSSALGFKFELTLFIKVTYRVLLMISAILNLILTKLFIQRSNSLNEVIIKNDNLKDSNNEIIISEKNKKKYLLTVIIPYYNNKDKEISKAINSVLKQKNINFKILILIIDDNSRKRIDLKKLKLVKINTKFFKIKILRKKRNEGVSRARLTGVKLSKSKYIAFLDSDDFWLPQKLFNQMIFLSKNNAKVVGCNWNNNTHFISYLSMNKEYYSLNKILLAIQWWPHISTLILEKKIFYKIKANKINNLRYAEDGDLLLKLASTNNLFILKKNLVTCHYFKKDYKSSGLSSSMKNMSNGEIMILKNNFDNKVIKLLLIVWVKFKYIVRTRLI